MKDATTLLFGLDGFRVVSVTRVQGEDAEHVEVGRRAVVEGVEEEQASGLRVLSGGVDGRKLRRVKDLPHGRRPPRLYWDQ